MATIPLMGIAPPIQNPLDTFSRLMGIKAAQQQMQTAALQQQGLGQENQIRQIQLQDQQGMRQAYIDAQGDPQKFLANLPKYNVSFEGMQKARQGVYQMQTDLLNLDAAQFAQHQRTADLYNGFLKQVKDAPPERRAQVWQQGASQFQGLPGVQIPPQYPGDQALDMLGYQGVTLSKALDNAKAQADIYKATEQGHEAAAKTAQLQPFTPDKISQLNQGMAQSWQVLHPGQPLPPSYQLSPGATQSDFQRLDSLMKNEIQVAGTKAQRDTANALHQQTVAIAQQGLEMKRALLDVNPVIAYNPQTGERELTTRSQADAQGLQGPVPVTEPQLEKYRSAQAQFNDVQANLSRYRAAARQFAQQGNPRDAALISAVINESKLGGGIHLGPVGVELPGYSSIAEAADRVARSASYKALSPAGKALVDGYLRTMSAVPAYQKALTGVGRFNKEIVDLELRNIPDPTYAPADIDRKLEAFQENVDQGAQSIPRIPGLPTIRDVRARFEGTQGSGGQRIPGLQIPQPFGAPASNFGGGGADPFAKFGGRARQ